MSERLQLTAQVRSQKGKNANRKLRAQGIIPGIFYSGAGDNLSLQFNEAALMKVYGQAGRTSLIDLTVEDGGKKSTYPCLIWDVERYPTKNRLQHIDFYGVDLNRELKIRVPLEFTGTAKGTKLGGRMEVFREIIFIHSKPAHLPKKIEVDISNLDVGQGLRIADLAMPEGVRAAYDVNYAIVNVTMPGADKGEGEEA